MIHINLPAHQWDFDAEGVPSFSGHKVERNRKFEIPIKRQLKLSGHDSRPCVRASGRERRKEGGAAAGWNDRGMQGPARVVVGKNWDGSVALKSMGEIVWVAGVNQSHSCPAVSQEAAPGRARGRSHVENSDG